ncbi:MAG: BON domain-containing protein [Pseudomonadota bacterium]
MRGALIALTCLAAVPLSGCALVTSQTLGESLDDATNSGEIKSKLLARGGYGEVDVEIVDGLVLLSGRVISPELRVKAEEIAWSSSRTRNVANEIQIEPPGGFRANVSDTWISTKVRSALTTARAVRGINYNIETYNGIVYLMGTARTQAELEAAATKASRVRGVREVVSYVKVRGTHETAGRTGDAALLGGPSYQAAPTSPYSDTPVTESPALGEVY